MTINELKNKYQLKEFVELYEKYRLISLNEKDSYGNGALHFAVSVADFEAVKILLERGVDVNEVGAYGNRPMHILAQCSSMNNIENVIRCAKLLLNNKASIIRKNDMGETPSIIAGRQNSLELIELFVERELKLDFTDNNGYSALHVVVSNCNKRNRERSIKIIKLLLKAGLDTNLKNNYGYSPIDMALNDLKDPEITAILKGDYDFDNPNNPQNLIAGMSLHSAILNKNYEIMKAHLKLGTDINEISEENNSSKFLSPLGTACYILDFEAVKLLVENGADVNLKNNNAETAVAVWFSYLGSQYFDFNSVRDKSVEKILKFLIEYGLNLNDIINEKGDSLLLAATGYLNKSKLVNDSSIPLEVINVLLKEKIDIDYANLEGKTALMNLCKNAENSDVDLIIELLESDASVEAMDKNAYTPAMYAAQNFELNVGLEIIKLLSDFGDIKLSHVNNDKQNLMDIAILNDNENLVNWILSQL